MAAGCETEGDRQGLKLWNQLATCARTPDDRLAVERRSMELREQQEARPVEDENDAAMATGAEGTEATGAEEVALQS